MNIFNHFQHINLTNDQRTAVGQVATFLEGEENIFILKGYAGSGKTTLLKGLVEYFREIDRKYQLMAPTGRAAQVINQKTGSEATTIHKGIYCFEELKEIEIQGDDNSGSFLYFYKIRNNREVHNSVLIVDEASMVSDTLSQGEFFRFGSGYLLKDLITYSRIQQAATNTKIIFIGDPAQLPPIGMNFSPALDEKFLEERYRLKVAFTEMKEVKRQDKNNGILLSASKIRRCLTSGFFNDFDLKENGKDIFNPAYKNFLETYKSQNGTKIILAYKNRTALYLNKTIRRDKFGASLPIQSGDTVIIGGNNYRLGILNGEFGVVTKTEINTISRNVSFYNKAGGTTSVRLTWRTIELLLPGDGGQPKSVKGYILENYLHGDNYLKPEEQQALYIDFKKRYPQLKPKTEEFKEAICTDPFFNCILLKFGYAVTCHKAQGGEWEHTFVFWDKGVPSHFNFFESQQSSHGKTNADFFRWAYTAITRASGKLYCINPPCFNSFSGMSFIDSHVQSAYQELTSQTVPPIEIKLEGAVLQALESFRLQDAPPPIQDHFLSNWHKLSKQFIDIVGWERKGYEIRYYFKRGKETAAFKFWVNGQNQFKDKFQKLPGGTNSDELFGAISKLIESPIHVKVSRKNGEPIFPKIVFDKEMEEQQPFLKFLFDSLTEQIQLLNIEAVGVNHQNYRERYAFLRGTEKAVIDFEYDGNGFFGRVVPLENRCNSLKLIEDIKTSIDKLQNSEYVV